MKIIVDTREQQPFPFSLYPCETETGTLRTGDYSIAGFEDKVTVERKSPTDLCGCITSSRERFERELERMRSFECAAVVIELPIQEITRQHFNTGLRQSSFEQSILSFSFRYRVPFFFGRHRPWAEWLAFNCLRHFWNKNCPPKDKIPYIEPPTYSWERKRSRHE